MATPLTDSINALTAYANEVTGGSDTNLSDAVHTLASGYGQGGLSPFTTMQTQTVIENTQEAKTFVENSFPNIQQRHLYIFLFKNTSTESYSGKAVVWYIGSSNASNPKFYRHINATENASTTWVFNVPIGTNVEAYDIELT